MFGTFFSSLIFFFQLQAKEFHHTFWSAEKTFFPSVVGKGVGELVTVSPRAFSVLLLRMLRLFECEVK